MPMRLFRNFKSDAIVACASIGAMVYYSGTVIWPTMAGTLFTTSIAEVGWLSCAVGGGLLFGQILAGIGIRSLPKMKWQMTVSLPIVSSPSPSPTHPLTHTSTPPRSPEQ